METIIKVYKRLVDVYVKQRFLIMALIVQSVILSLMMLIYVNVILSNANINGELNYAQIRFFYNFAIFLLFALICVYAPILFSNTINNLYKNNVIEHMLTAKVKISDIVFAVFMRGFFTMVVLLFSALPIISISFYFGGIGVVKIIRLFVFIISFALLLSSICIFISTKFIDINLALIISYITSVIFTVFNLYILNIFLASTLMTVFYTIFSIVISLALFSMSRRTNIFSA